MRIAVNIVLLLAVVSLIGANWIVRNDAGRPNYEFLPQMAHGERYNAFSQNPNFTNRSTLQKPPDGGIARGYMPLHYSSTPEDALRAGRELSTPIPSGSQQATSRGAMVFANYCAVCHGAAGAGNGPVTQRGVPPPPPLTAPHAAQMKDGQLFHVLTYGQNNMPSYASQLSRLDRWNVIAYVRDLQATAAKAAAKRATIAGGQP
ncbi:MAG: c-type cytochrome [Terriglobales bacterium]